MSHHLDTPLAAQTGQLYIDNSYVFPGEGRIVVVIDVNSNVNGLHSEPGGRNTRETNSMGEMEVLADRYRAALTQRSLIGR